MVKASDSWLSGVKGGQPGIIMPGNPQPGDKYRQEYYPPGQALDEAHVLTTDGNVKVPYGSYKHVLVTSEFSPLEPQTEQKYYVPGLGEAAERVVKGHHEEFQLVSVTQLTARSRGVRRCGQRAGCRLRPQSLPYTPRAMETVLGVVQVIISVVLIFLVLLHSGKDAGLSGAFGIGQTGSSFGGGSLVERNLDRWTVFFAILFVVNTLVLLKI